MRRSLVLCFVSFLALIGDVQATSLNIGTLADWKKNPTQTLGDKKWTYLEDNGKWSGLEHFTLSTNVPQTSHSLGITGLSDYIGPITLEVGYRIDVTSTYWMSLMALDQDRTGDNVTTTKDLYGTEKEFKKNTAVGSGTLGSLTVVNNGLAADITLPTWTQHLWVRDTIVIDASGSLFSVSNTVTQVVPEPGSMTLAAMGACATAAGMLRKRLGLRRAQAA